MRRKVRFRKPGVEQEAEKQFSVLEWIRSWFRRRTPEPEIAPEVPKTKHTKIRPAIHIKKCQACGLPLRLSEIVTCPAVADHKVHKACIEKLTKGKCPICGHAMELTCI